MGDIGDYWREAHEYQSKIKESRRAMEAESFVDVAGYARKNGFNLQQISEIHYQLIPDDDSWILNIYPGNRRLYHDPNRRGPYIEVADPWCLLNVIEGAIKARKKQVKK